MLLTKTASWSLAAALQHVRFEKNLALPKLYFRLKKNEQSNDSFDAVQDDFWAIFPPKRVQWPSQAQEDFFSYVYDWDTLEILYGSVSRLSVNILLCSSLFPCKLSIEGREGANLLQSSGGSILCQDEIGCDGVQVTAKSSVSF